jgi:hypothetical protein
MLRFQTVRPLRTSALKREGVKFGRFVRGEVWQLMQPLAEGSRVGHASPGKAVELGAEQVVQSRFAAACVPGGIEHQAAGVPAAVAMHDFHGGR